MPKLGSIEDGYDLTSISFDFFTQKTILSN